MRASDFFILILLPCHGSLVGVDGGLLVWFTWYDIYNIGTCIGTLSSGFKLKTSYTHNSSSQRYFQTSTTYKNPFRGIWWIYIWMDRRLKIHFHERLKIYFREYKLSRMLTFSTFQQTRFLKPIFNLGVNCSKYFQSSRVENREQKRGWGTVPPLYT